MHQPVLVIMAAGLGSRYGGLKQIDPLGPNGQIILDYSIYDAYRAGFRRVVFIIKPDSRTPLSRPLAARPGASCRSIRLSDAVCPAGRPCRPGGTRKAARHRHAVYCVKDAVDAPFAVINADDFYGADAFAKIYAFLSTARTTANTATVWWATRSRTP